MDGNWYLVTDQGAKAVSDVVGSKAGHLRSVYVTEPSNLEPWIIPLAAALIALLGGLAGYGLRGIQYRRLAPSVS